LRHGTDPRGITRIHC